MAATRVGAGHRAVRELRALLRDRRVRADLGACVVEGPRAVVGALDRGVAVEALFVSAPARAAHGGIVARVEARGGVVHELGDGVAERVATTRAPQGLWARVRPEPVPRDALAGASFVLVATCINDPGNAGTIVRSAEAFGAEAVVLGAGSVDAYNPKVVRSSAGAVFGVPVLEGRSVVEVLETLGHRGVRRLGAVARAGTSAAGIDLREPVAIVLGHEVRGIPAALPVDAPVHVPMAGPGESLNVAMAATVLAYEVARQRGGASR